MENTLFTSLVVSQSEYFMLQMAFIIKLQVVGKALFAIDRYIHIPY